MTDEKPSIITKKKSTIDTVDDTVVATEAEKQPAESTELVKVPEEIAIPVGVTPTASNATGGQYIEIGGGLRVPASN